MKSLPVRFLSEADADIEEILEYVSEASGSFDVALGFLDRILNRCYSIGDAPFAAVSREELGAGMRLVPFERSTAIVYRVADDVVEIVGIFYGGRDIATLMTQRS